MTIVIDARCVHQTISGIDRYVLGLLGGIAKSSVAGSDPIKVLVRPESMVRCAVSNQSCFELVECAWSPWGFRSQANLPRLLRSLPRQLPQLPRRAGHGDGARDDGPAPRSAAEPG